MQITTIALQSPLRCATGRLVQGVKLFTEPNSEGEQMVR